MPSIKRAIRIAGSSGGFSDRQRAIGDLARSCDIDCIIGDWLSECTMTLHGAQKQENERLRKAGKLAQEPVGLFDPTFMENLSPALPYLRSKNIKVAVNAGASDTELLAGVVEAEVGKQGLDLKVGWINGDEVTETVRRMWQDGETFTSLMTGKPLQDWGHMDEFVAAQCYLGGAGIAEALRQGCDIVIAGRRTEDKALLVRGNVSIPDMSSIETTKVANGSNSQRAQEYTANSLGSVSLAYDTATIDQIPQPGDLYSSDDPLFFCDDGGCIYAFHEVNTKSALDPDSFPITAVTNRLVRVDTICRSCRVTSGGDGLFENITIADSSSRGGARNVTLPVLGGSDQSTFFTDTMAPCGPTCGSVSVFEASSSSPWLYECNTTVGTPTNASLPEHALGDDLVWMVAMAVALQGYSTTAADEDLQVQGIVYPAATYWGTPMSGSSDALALLMSRFAIGVLGMAAQSNTALFKRQFNALITGLLITLGLSTASFLTGMCDDMRWWILSRRARSQHKVEHILHAHSTSRVIRLALRSKRSNIHVVVTLWVLLIIGAQVGIASIGLCY
ncbi:hypothetical protein BN1723_017187, partial [Verticillium longisporum]